MTIPSSFNLDELPDELQREMYGALKPKFEKRRRAGNRVAKEVKVRAVGEIIRSLNGFTLPQQRAVLLFALSIIEQAQHRFWRDGKVDPKTQKVKR